ncbi:Chaperone surA [Gossypium australe]|uniref:Chaperone surA n=1 Tax=Gossypium australe TaxID=47621 RepID=A0A5B6WN67_9ROSI|nr:Chaperone surA [Gossypium australe]
MMLKVMRLPQFGGAASSGSRPASKSRGRVAKEAFFQMMNEWFTEYVRTNPAAQHPPPTPFPQSIPLAPQVLEPVCLSESPVDKIRKYGVEEFRATVDDDPEIVELWLENMIRVFDELSCTPSECVKCVVSLLKDTVY